MHTESAASQAIQEFIDRVWEHYRVHARDLPWRRVSSVAAEIDPYLVLVSEVMLQQTSVPRVLPKFESFMRQFESLKQLAAAPLADVLVAWSGLGYNRRARFLHDAARALSAAPKPWTYDLLVALPGIGPNTARAILVYSYNQQHLFIETNVRTAIIYHFFPQDDAVGDPQITVVMEGVLARLGAGECRDFYWGLMDYGSYLKKMTGNHSRRSRHYTKQSPFEGSRRQVRGRILKLLAIGSMPHAALDQQIHDERFEEVLAELIKEGLVSLRDTGQVVLGAGAE